MSISTIIKAPLSVQLNRAAFILYSGVFGWFFWHNRQALWHGGFGNDAWTIGTLFCTLLGFICSFVRARRSRWVLAILVVLISPVFVSIVIAAPFALITSINKSPLDVLMILDGTAFPWTLALILFFDKKAEEYFTGQVDSSLNAKTIKQRLFLILPNTCAFFAFLVLWVWQYHINIKLSDKIDHAVVPWLWVLLFFITSLLTLGTFSIKSTIKSLGLSLVLACYLIEFIQAILEPIFDPML